MNEVATIDVNNDEDEVAEIDETVYLKMQIILMAMVIIILMIMLPHETEQIKLNDQTQIMLRLLMNKMRFELCPEESVSNATLPKISMRLHATNNIMKNIMVCG